MKIKLEKIEELIDGVKSYAATNIEIVKLEVANRSSVLVSKLLSKLFLGIVIFLFVLFFSLGISLFLSELLENNYLGFGIVASFYLLLAIIFSLGRKILLERPIRESFIKELFSNDNN